MRPSNIIIGILLLILYVGVFIPLILPVVMSLFMDWVNNSGNMFIQEYCVLRQVYNSTTNSFDTIRECSQYDFRPLIVFLFQIVVYFAIPIILLYKAFKR